MNEAKPRSVDQIKADIRELRAAVKAGDGAAVTHISMQALARHVTSVPLDPRIAAVLSEHAWDLYARSEQ